MPDYTTQGQIKGQFDGLAAGRSQEQYPQRNEFAMLGTAQDVRKSDLETATDHLTQAIELLNARAIAMHEKLRTAGLLNDSERAPGEVLSGAMPGVSTPYANHLIQLAEKVNETSRLLQVTTNLLGV